MKASIVAVTVCLCIAKEVCSWPQSSCDHLGSPKISYKDASSDEDILKLGCNIKCRLTEAKVFKDGIIYSSIVDPDFKEPDVIKECEDKFHEITGEKTCEHFYELWKCLEKLREPWSHLENTTDIEGKCVENIDCYGKCVYEEVGIFREDVFTSENTPEHLPPEYRKYIIKSLNLCNNITNESYEENEKYSCKYFEDFDVCFKKEFIIF